MTSRSLRGAKSDLAHGNTVTLTLPHHQAR